MALWRNDGVWQRMTSPCDIAVRLSNPFDNIDNFNNNVESLIGGKLQTYEFNGK